MSSESKITEIEARLESIESRNKRVEADKRWETSWQRKILILTLTYLVVLIYFFIIEVEKPFLNALVPTLGFFLSTLTVSFAKHRWLQKQKLTKE